MSDIVIQRNIGAMVSVKRATAAVALTADGSGDATAVTGVTIDRFALNMPMSLVATTVGEGTLASGATLSLLTNIQHSADDTAYTSLTSEASIVVLTGASGGSVASGFSHSVAVDLSSAKRYVKICPTPDLSAAGTDTAVLRVVAVLAGENPLPAAAVTV